MALDAKTFKEIQRFDAGSDPERFVVSRDGSRLYSANEDAGTATVTDVQQGQGDRLAGGGHRARGGGA